MGQGRSWTLEQLQQRPQLTPRNRDGSSEVSQIGGREGPDFRLLNWTTCSFEDGVQPHLHVPAPRKPPPTRLLMMGRKCRSRTR